MISVVISTYNRPEMLYRTVYSFVRQGYADYEVLVSIDDDPKVLPQTEAICVEFAKTAPVRWFLTGQYKRAPGWSLDTYPMNVGIRQAKGDIIMINTGDVMSVNNTLATHAGLQATLTRPSAVFSTVHAVTKEVQDRMDTYDWKSNPKCLLFKGSCYKMFCGRGVSYTPQYQYEDAGVPYYWQVSVAKSHLEDIRGLDEDFWGNAGGCADDDLADRLKRKGLEFYYSPEALAIHQCHGDPLAISDITPSCPKLTGHQLFAQRRTQGIIRNINHEWGQYPRDVAALPELSGAK